MMSKWFLSHIVVLGLTTRRKSTLQISLRFCTTTTTTSESNTHPFAVTYLINNFGFTPESALKAFNQKQVIFQSPQKPNSVINFFKNRDFSHSNIQIIIRKAPWLLSSQPHNVILPKYRFLQSKGLSSSDIVSLLTENPRILQTSLKKRIIPLFEFLSRFFQTNKDIIVCLIRNSRSFVLNPYHILVANVNLMTDFGVCDSAIARLLQTSPFIFGSTDLIKSLEEVKGLGFDPSMTTFGDALIANKCTSRTRWDEKFDVFKKWGWSDDDFFQAFRLHPSLMMASIEKIDFLISFWVNELGWDLLALIKCPRMFSYSLEKRIIPRASVLQFLLMKGLQNKNASLVTPFDYSEKLFLSKFVFSFKGEFGYLLKLYEEKMKLPYSKENNGMPFTK